MARLGTLTKTSSRDDVAEAIVLETIRRGYTRDQAVPILADAIQESGLRPTAVSRDGRWVGIFQQDTSYPGRDDPNRNIEAFLDRLDAKLASPGASSDIWLNIFWLQQRPSDVSAAAAYANGRQAYLAEIKSRTAEAAQLYERYAQRQATGAAVSGDPVWLEDVLRPVLGDRLKTLPGWKTDGVGGTMGTIWGVMWHHTGNSKETAQSISKSRPDLKGPLAQLHIAPDGIVTIVAVGPCNHAGVGSYPGLPTNAANSVTIGVECAWPDIAKDGSYDPAQKWPDPQLVSMREVGAALTKHLGVPVSHNIGHKEWAGASQGKWDPGNLDMNWFRGEIQKDIDGYFDPKPEVGPTPQPGPILAPDYEKEVWDQLRYQWPQLGGQTLVKALGEIRDKVLGVTDHADWEAGR